MDSHCVIDCHYVIDSVNEMHYVILVFQVLYFGSCLAIFITINFNSLPRSSMEIIIWFNIFWKWICHWMESPSRSWKSPTGFIPIFDQISYLVCFLLISCFNNWWLCLSLNMRYRPLNRGSPDGPSRKTAPRAYYHCFNDYTLPL